MTPKLFLLALLPLAFGEQVAFVDLSKPDLSSGQQYPLRSENVMMGAVLGHGEKKTPASPIRLVINEIIPERAGILVRYVAKVVLTNEGDAAMSVPVGPQADSLLEPAQHNRNALVFTAAFAKSGRALLQAGATSASNSEHPESSVILQRGDSAVFLLPLGSWPADRPPSDEIIVKVQRQRKVVEDGKDWTQYLDPIIRSENALPLPPPPAKTDAR